VDRWFHLHGRCLQQIADFNLAGKGWIHATHSWWKYNCGKDNSLLPSTCATMHLLLLDYIRLTNKQSCISFYFRPHALKEHDWIHDIGVHFLSKICDLLYFKNNCHCCSSSWYLPAVCKGHLESLDKAMTPRGSSASGTLHWLGQTSSGAPVSAVHLYMPIRKGGAICNDSVLNS
jgi:hypothetical protein